MTRIVARAHLLVFISLLVSASALSAAELKPGAKPALAAPVLTRIEPTAEGYALIGSNFGTNKDQVQVFEGATQVPPASVLSVASDRITVRSSPSGVVQHKVVVGTQASGSVPLTHAVASAAKPRPSPPKSDPARPSEAKPAAGSTAPTKPPGSAAAAAPRSLTLGALSATGHRAEAAAIRGITAGSGATGQRADAAPARNLTLGTLSADGWRQ